METVIQLVDLVDGRIYKVNNIQYDYPTGITSVSLKQISFPMGDANTYRPENVDNTGVAAGGLT